MRTIIFITAMFLWASVVYAQDKPRVVLDEKDYDYVINKRTVPSDSGMFVGNNKRVLVIDRMTIKGVAGKDTLTLRGWEFYVSDDLYDNLASIIIDSAVFRCYGCKFVSACGNTWTGIMLENTAGIVLDSIAGVKKPSLISNCQTGVYNREYKLPQAIAFNRYRVMSIRNTRIENCQTGIGLSRYNRDFVANVDRISNNTIVSDTSYMRLKTGRKEREAQGIVLKWGNYVRLQVGYNKLRGCYEGIIAQSANVNVSFNSIEGCVTGIRVLDDYSENNPTSWNINLFNNTVVLPKENEVFSFNATPYKERTGIYVSSQKANVQSNKISTAKRNSEYYRYGVQYRGIVMESQGKYQIVSNTVEVRDDGLVLRNMGTMLGALISNNLLTDHYYGVRFVANNTVTSNPVVSLRCNTIQINTINGNKQKFCISIEANTILDRLGGCSTNNTPCGNVFNIAPSIAMNISEWKHINSENGRVFQYHHEPGEFMGIPFNKLEINNSIIQAVACTTRGVTSGCNKPMPAPMGARQSLMAEIGRGMTPSELQQERAILAQGMGDEYRQNEAVHKVGGYYLFHKDLQGLEDFTNSLADGRHKAQLSHILYVSYMDTMRISEAIQRREYIARTYPEAEIQHWSKHTEWAENTGEYIRKPYQNTLADTLQQRQVAQQSQLLQESACLRIGEKGNCQSMLAGTANKRTSVQNTYPMQYNTGRDTLNLVPNYSFELLDETICPYFDSVYIGGTYYRQDRATTIFAGWNYTYISPDLMHRCNEGVADTWNRLIGAPNNWMGYQHPAKGNGYMGGLISGDVVVFETAGTNLTRALDTAKTYYVGFRVSLSNRSRGATNKQGIYFSMEPFAPVNDGWPKTRDTMHVYSDNIVIDTLNWTIVLKKYKPDSAYRYITIGNLYGKTRMSHMYTPWFLDPNATCDFCYYFDDIVVTEDSLYAHEILTGIKPRREASLAERDRVKLYPNPTTGKVTIQMPEAERVRIYHAVGILIKEIDLSAGEHEIDLSAYPAGMYVVHIGREHHKLMKE